MVSIQRGNVLGLIMLTIRHRWRGGSSSYTAINGSSSRGSFVDTVDIAHGDKRSFADIATLQLAPLLWPINCASASVCGGSAWTLG